MGKAAPADPKAKPGDPKKPVPPGTKVDPKAAQQPPLKPGQKADPKLVNFQVLDQNATASVTPQGVESSLD